MHRHDDVWLRFVSVGGLAPGFHSHGRALRISNLATAVFARRGFTSAVSGLCVACDVLLDSLPTTANRLAPEGGIADRHHGDRAAGGRPDIGVAGVVDTLRRARCSRMVDQHGAGGDTEYIGGDVRFGTCDAVGGGGEAAYPATAEWAFASLITRHDQARRSAATPPRRRKRRHQSRPPNSQGRSSWSRPPRAIGDPATRHIPTARAAARDEPCCAGRLRLR